MLLTLVDLKRERINRHHVIVSISTVVIRRKWVDASESLFLGGGGGVLRALLAVFLSWIRVLWDATLCHF